MEVSQNGWFFMGGGSPILGNHHVHKLPCRSSLPSADGPDADFPVPEPWIDDAEHQGMEQVVGWVKDGKGRMCNPLWMQAISTNSLWM